MSTSYILSVKGTSIKKNQPSLNKAREAAQAYADENQVEVQVHLNTADGSQLLAFTATHVHGRDFHPWERSMNVKFAVPHFPGWTLGYERRRISAAVFRNNDDTADLKWRVWDGRTGGFEDVATTRAACKLTSAMRHGKQLVKVGA